MGVPGMSTWVQYSRGLLFGHVPSSLERNQNFDIGHILGISGNFDFSIKQLMWGLCVKKSYRKLSICVLNPNPGLG